MLKLKKKKKKNKRIKNQNNKKRMIVKMVTVYLGHSLVLWTVYGQFIFG